VTTLFLVAYTIAQLASGLAIDRIGTRLGFALCVVVWSAAAALHALARGAASLSALRFLLGLSEAGNWPAGAKAVAEWFPKERRAFAMGVFDGGSAVGAILAPPLVALLCLVSGWRTAFVATGALGLLWTAVWLSVYRPGPEQSAPVHQRDGLRRMLRLRSLWGLMLTRMLATPVWWFYVFWLPDYLNKGRGFTLKEIGLFGWIPFLSVDIGKLLGGGLSDRLLARGWTATTARKSVMAVGALAMLGGVRVAGADSSAGAIAWVSVATFGFGMWSANILALHADIFPAGAMATAMGFTGTAASLGGAAFTYATGWMVDSSGYAPVFWVAGTAALVALLSLVFVLGKVEAVKLAS
jgi:ACS family hexuronate transporter-like MFS transporter